MPQIHHSRRATARHSRYAATASPPGVSHQVRSPAPDPHGTASVDTIAPSPHSGPARHDGFSRSRHIVPLRANASHEVGGAERSGVARRDVPVVPARREAAPMCRIIAYGVNETAAGRKRRERRHL